MIILLIKLFQKRKSKYNQKNPNSQKVKLKSLKNYKRKNHNPQIKNNKLKIKKKK